MISPSIPHAHKRLYVLSLLSPYQCSVVVFFSISVVFVVVFYACWPASEIMSHWCSFFLCQTKNNSLPNKQAVLILIRPHLILSSSSLSVNVAAFSTVTLCVTRFNWAPDSLATISTGRRSNSAPRRSNCALETHLYLVLNQPQPNHVFCLNKNSAERRIVLNLAPSWSDIQLNHDQFW